MQRIYTAKKVLIIEYLSWSSAPCEQSLEAGILVKAKCTYESCQCQLPLNICDLIRLVTHILKIPIHPHIYDVVRALLNS